VPKILNKRVASEALLYFCCGTPYTTVLRALLFGIDMSALSNNITSNLSFPGKAWE
jgi:hypothetical protein